jgi:hypothetical protein
MGVVMDAQNGSSECMHGGDGQEREGGIRGLASSGFLTDNLRFFLST